MATNRSGMSFEKQEPVQTEEEKKDHMIHVVRLILENFSSCLNCSQRVKVVRIEERSQKARKRRSVTDHDSMRWVKMSDEMAGPNCGSTQTQDD
jgi:hypothetical protein